MKVYRLCNSNEIKSILEDKCFVNIGHKHKTDFKKSTHIYSDDYYMHFFDSELKLLYLYPSVGKMICVYDIPYNILFFSKGRGFYFDFISLNSIQKVSEYAVPSKKIQFKFLKQVFTVTDDLDFDYLPTKEELYNSLKIIYDSTSL